MSRARNSVAPLATPKRKRINAGSSPIRRPVFIALCAIIRMLTTWRSPAAERIRGVMMLLEQATLEAHRSPIIVPAPLQSVAAAAVAAKVIPIAPYLEKRKAARREAVT